MPGFLVLNGFDCKVAQFRRLSDDRGNSNDYAKRRYSAVIILETEQESTEFRTAVSGGGAYHRSINGTLTGRGPIVPMSGTLPNIPAASPMQVGVEVAEEEYIRHRAANSRTIPVTLLQE